MKTARFLTVQALLLGPCSFVVWALLGARGSWPFSLSIDTFAATVLGTALTALFLATIALPIQLCIRDSVPLPPRLVSGLVSGTLGVWLGLWVLSSYSIGWEWYVSRAWSLHLVYGGVGLAFAWMWFRWRRANGEPQKSSKY